MRTERVTTNGASTKERRTQHIVELAVVGAHGGYRGGDKLTIKEALLLRQRLAYAVDQLIGRFEREMREAQEEKKDE